jgi:hypothetical protein
LQYQQIEAWNDPSIGDALTSPHAVSESRQILLENRMHLGLGETNDANSGQGRQRARPLSRIAPLAWRILCTTIKRSGHAMTRAPQRVREAIH